MKLVDEFGDLVAESDLVEWDEREQGWRAGGLVVVDPAKRFRVQPAVPISITPRQGALILSRYGLLGQVQTALGGMEGQTGEEARIDFEKASSWDRDWPLLNAMAHGLGLSDGQIDQMFIEGSGL